jgi:8-oxo-dGTP diphosphatase
MSQSSLAARMRELGYSWYPQTIGVVERGERRLEVGEALALALALETSLGALLDPTFDDRLVELPSGDAILANTVQRSVRHFNDGMVSWVGDKPRIATREPESWPDTDIGRDLRAKTAEWESMRQFGNSHADMVERNSRLHPEPPGGWPEPGPPPKIQRPVVAVIVTSPKGVLIGRRNDGKPPWTFIAGEVEPGEQPEDAAIREVKEETGVEIRVGRVIGERDHPATGRHMIYMAATPARATRLIVGDEAELAEVRWVSLAEADELLPGMFSPVREHLARELGPEAGS